MTLSSSPPLRRIDAERWPTEIPLTVAVVLAALFLWLLLIVSIVGVVYAAMIAAFFFVSHVAFVSYVRGSGVRLGPAQFPEIYHRVNDLSRAMEMDPPVAYLMQAGGSLNAFATRLLGRNIVVLYSDLLEACEDNAGARDMIIAHELAHLKCGHLRWMWLLLPGHFVPFLGSALSRAREYTCDRFGLLGAGNTRDATLGLAILSAGAKYAHQVNLEAFVTQRADLNTGLMTLGEWFASHPPLAKRVVALDPGLGDPRFHPTRGRVMAVAIIAFVSLGSAGVTVAAAGVASRFFGDAASAGSGGIAMADPAAEQVQADFRRLSAFIGEEWGAAGLPADMAAVHDRWTSSRTEAFPVDPFDGYEYGYMLMDVGYRLWSSGPDAMAGTDDDIVFDSAR